MVSVLAVMATRNEGGYIEIALQSLIDEGIEVVLVDNGSIDGTPELAAAFLGRGLLRIEHLPFHGSFDLLESLKKKRDIIATANHDWLMHVDADEWHRAPTDVRIADMLEGVGGQYLAVDFDEFVFLPSRGVDMVGGDYRKLATDYYYFAPSPHRRVKLWRAGHGLDNIEGGGHTIPGLDPDAIYPRSLPMRHYLGLSWSHAVTKRADRTYSEADRARGWHGNRLDLRGAYRLVSSLHWKAARPWDARELDRSSPSVYHFWESGFENTEV